MKIKWDAKRIAAYYIYHRSTLNDMCARIRIARDSKTSCFHMCSEKCGTLNGAYTLLLICCCWRKHTIANVIIFCTAEKLNRGMYCSSVFLLVH